MAGLCLVVGQVGREDGAEMLRVLSAAASEPDGETPVEVKKLAFWCVLSFWHCRMHGSERVVGGWSVLLEYLLATAISFTVWTIFVSFGLKQKLNAGIWVEKPRAQRVVQRTRCEMLPGFPGR